MVVLTSFAPPQEGVIHEQAATEAHLKKGVIGKGTLYIAESRVSWRGENGEGFSLEYPGISLHAVSRDLNSYPKPCLYLMLDSNIDSDDENSGDSSSDETDSSLKTSEVRFVPEDPLALDMMYQAMCDCQALHPDEEDDDSADEDGDYVSPEQEAGQGDFFTDPDDMQQLTEQGQQTLQRLEQMFQHAGSVPGQQQQQAQNGHTNTQSTGSGEMETEDQFADAEEMQ